MQNLLGKFPMNKAYFQNSMINMHYNDTSRISVELEYLYGLTRFGIKPGLAVMQQMMDALGHPEQKFKSIHVTGTNGKGSACAMIESMLRTGGNKVALYTSPHLYAFNERIQINRVPITDEELVAFVREIRLVCEARNISPTFFEFTTALAYLYFSRSNIDIAVVEVGMGGRYDATNVITPILSVITNVGLDHTEFFGPTKEHVALEKAGIIKQGVSVLLGNMEQGIQKIFEDEAITKHANVVHVNDVVSARIISADLDGQEVSLSFRPPSRNLRGSRVKPGMTHIVHLPLLGSHQVENMKTAIAALFLLSQLDGGTLTQNGIAAGIAKTQWEGRLQIISRKPLIIIDGAHNGDGAHALARFLDTVPSHDVLVFAAKQGKDISDMLKSIIPLFTTVVITEGSFMPEPADTLAEAIRPLGVDVIVERNGEKAFDIAQGMVPEEGTLLVTGSLYMIADVLAHLRKKKV